MTTPRELAPENWSEYLDAVSRELHSAQVSIEIREGEQRPVREKDHAALQGMAYDRSDDVFEVAVRDPGDPQPGTHRHLVDHPARIMVDSWTLLAPMTIAVDGPDGVRTIVRIAGEPERAA